MESTREINGKDDDAIRMRILLRPDMFPKLHARVASIDEKRPKDRAQLLMMLAEKALDLEALYSGMRVSPIVAGFVADGDKQVTFNSGNWQAERTPSDGVHSEKKTEVAVTDEDMDEIGF